MVSYSFQGENRLWTVQDEDGNGKTFLHSMKERVANELPCVSDTSVDREFSKWPVSQIMRLLRFYAAHRCLWDLESDGNRNRMLRQVALIDITAAMGDGFTKDEIVQKINVIRATYRYEKKRIKQRMRRGQGARTKLKWFALADAFLRCVPKKGHSKEDPRNSDSDLEDTIIFTINPETLLPLKPEIFVDEPTLKADTTELFLQPKTEAFSDDTQSAWEVERDGTISSDDDSVVLASLIKPKIELLEKEMQEQLKAYSQAINTRTDDNEKNINFGGSIKVIQPEKGFDPIHETIVESNYSTSSSSWTLNTSLLFINQLKAHPVLWRQHGMDTDEHSKQEALSSIAKFMKKPVKSIAKRLDILKKTYEEEKQKMLENQDYKSPYKWWLEAENLMQSHGHIKTESIYLKENENSQSSSENYEDYGVRFQNPIPSVAPMSNMNEAMASLFHEDFSLGSATNSSHPLETDASSHTAKIVWNALEDDLLEGKWSLKHSVKFLRLYGVHRCLWDLNDPDYRSRTLRNAAIEDIAASMGHGLTSAYVAKKIKIFRITYMQQRKRILEATKRGETPDIMLKWFPLADSFLRPHIGLRSIKSDVKEVPQFDFQYVYANLNLIDPALLTDFRGKGTQNAIAIGNAHEESTGSSEAEEC